MSASSKLSYAKRKYLALLKSKGINPSLVKYCPCCQKFLYKTEFFLDSHSQRQLVSHCKSCAVAENARKHAKYKEAKDQLVQQMKGDEKCAECGRCSKHLHFAHYHYPGGGQSSLKQLSIPQIIQESQKGRFLCYECHFEETAEENASEKDEDKILTTQQLWVQQRRKALEECRTRRALERKKCADCIREVTAENARFFQWDHRDPSRKKHNISAMVYRNATVENLETEMKECDLVCYDCHQERTNKQWKQGILFTQRIKPATASDGRPFYFLSL
jgi:hypothetical protein